MKNEKKSFLMRNFIPLLKKLKEDERGKWGMMTARQMVEHFVDAVKNANGKLVLPLLNAGEKLQKYRSFLMTDKPFRPNIKNSLIPKDGIPPRRPDMQSAINKLQKELDYFFELFEKHAELKTANPFFGELDYDMNIQLLYKLAMHHLKQFRLV